MANIHFKAASAWNQNGDHPDDYAKDKLGFENGELRTWSGQECREMDWEGQVVRYYRHPAIGGGQQCAHCGRNLHDHGWIDESEGGLTVCPGDWILTTVTGHHIPCKPEVFHLITGLTGGG